MLWKDQPWADVIDQVVAITTEKLRDLCIISSAVDRTEVKHTHSSYFIQVMGLQDKPYCSWMQLKEPISNELY